MTALAAALCATAGTLVVLLAPAPAALVALLAAPSVGEGVPLEWLAPPACPREGRVRHAINHYLARESFGPELTAVAVSGAITDDPDGWRLRVSVTLPSGSVQRDVVSAECSELADAAGLIIAVALDPLRVVETAKQEPEPAPSVAPAPPEPRQEEPPSAELPPNEAPPPDPRPRVRPVDIDLRVGGVGEFGTLGVLRGGIHAGFGIVGRRYRVDLALQYWAPRRVRPFQEEPDAGVAVQQGGIGGRGCLMSRLRPVELSTCLGFEAGIAWARGIGLHEPRVTRLPWAAAVVGQEVSWISRRRVGVFAGVDAMLHVVRPRFRVGGLGVVAETRWVGLRILAGPVLRL